MNQEQTYTPQESFFRAATACPEVSVADVPTNVERITALFHEAADQDVSLVTFPELSVTGYTLGDLVQQTQLLNQAEIGLQRLAAETENKQTAMVVGLPLRVQHNLYNCAAVLANGKIQGIVPKSNLPTYNEFYEDRWFRAWDSDNTEIVIGEERIPFGTNQLFEIGNVQTGIEICEDAWINKSPSPDLVEKGAVIITNPSASPELIGKAAYRRKLVEVASGKMIAGYIYAGCDTSESTAEIVMGGHQLIATNARLIAERKPFSKAQLTIADIDFEHLVHDRLKQQVEHQIGALVVATETVRTQEDLRVHIDKNPFLPDESIEDRTERLDMALNIQAHGLAQRMRATHQERLVLGLSGGLDSTLALLVAHKAAGILGKDPMEMIHTITMPGPASSEHTQTNAQLLALQLGVRNTVIPIGDLTKRELELLQHDGVQQDVTYENVQARARANLLFNYGNMYRAMVLGTGDLSEIALGWCTYNADQQSHYHVNGSIPKTMVKHLVAHMATQPEYAQAENTLQAILGTVVSPELTKTVEGEITQSTEDIIGPYELHDFFLSYLLRWGDTPAKITYLAKHAFTEDYTPEEIDTWFDVFIRRFATSQFKRETMPNSPKVGISLSPRGDWRMPPDLYNKALWEDRVY